MDEILVYELRPGRREHCENKAQNGVESEILQGRSVEARAIQCCTCRHIVSAKLITSDLTRPNISGVRTCAVQNRALEFIRYRRRAVLRRQDPSTRPAAHSALHPSEGGVQAAHQHTPARDHHQERQERRHGESSNFGLTGRSDQQLLECCLVQFCLVPSFDKDILAPHTNCI